MHSGGSGVYVAALCSCRVLFGGGEISGWSATCPLYEDTHQTRPVSGANHRLYISVLVIIFGLLSAFRVLQLITTHAGTTMSSSLLCLCSFIFDFFAEAGLSHASCTVFAEQCSKAISFLTSEGKSLFKNGNNIQKFLDAVKVCSYLYTPQRKHYIHWCCVIISFDIVLTN